MVYRQNSFAIALHLHPKRGIMFLRRNAKWLAAISFVLFIPFPGAAQVTHGQKPNLPQPFATKSAGNGPAKSQAAQAFLPTLPPRFHITLFPSPFTLPRF